MRKSGTKRRRKSTASACRTCRPTKGLRSISWFPSPSARRKRNNRRSLIGYLSLCPGFRQVAARKGRFYESERSLRCAMCRYRHVAHRNHRHKAQGRGSRAPVWRRTTAVVCCLSGTLIFFNFYVFFSWILENHLYLCGVLMC